MANDSVFTSFDTCQIKEIVGHKQTFTMKPNLEMDNLSLSSSSLRVVEMTFIYEQASQGNY